MEVSFDVPFSFRRTEKGIEKRKAYGEDQEGSKGRISE
jgi:hypothetical protein